jgi:hypothetical protein
MRAARPLLAAFVLASSVLAVLAAPGCSSKETAVVAGGAKWQFQGSKCQDRTVHTLAINATGDNGQPVERLLSDGADGARVRCQLDDAHFNVALSNASGALVAAGSISGKTSSNATFTFNIPQGTYKTTLQLCSLAILVNDGSSFSANITCPQLDNQSLSGDECSIDNTGSSITSYMQFESCTGF